MGMTFIIVVLLTATLVYHSCNGINLQNEILNILERRRLYALNLIGNSRRQYGEDDSSTILGAPRYPNHLPEAEPILPGHTLIRPTLGMLKSSLKFPHRDMDNGAGVYGNTNNILGIRWDGTNERLSYSGFRRIPSDFAEIIPVRALISAEDNEISSIGNKPYIGSGVWLPYHPYHKPSIEIENIYPTKKKRELQTMVDTQSEDEWKTEKNRIKQYLILHRFSQQKDERQPTTQRPTIMKNKVYHSSNNLKFLKLMLQKMNKRDRRQADIVALQPTTEVGSDEQALSFEYIDDDKITTTEAPRNISTKTKWFWNSKTMYDHVKFDTDAPDIDEYMPSNAKVLEDDTNTWWYFNEVDYQPFSSLH